MIEADVINTFKYEGYNISSYAGSIEIVDADESKMIDGNKKVIVALRTFSCTNILVYNDDFAYLAHMLPSETVGKNNDFERRLQEIKQIFDSRGTREANIIISLGKASDNKNQGFHNLSYIIDKLNSLANYCSERNIVLNILPVLRSKYFLFDVKNQWLIVNNKDKATIDVKKLEYLKRTLPVNYQEKNDKTK